MLFISWMFGSGSIRFRCSSIVADPKLSAAYKESQQSANSSNQMSASAIALKQMQGSYLHCALRGKSQSNNFNIVIFMFLVRQTVDDILQSYRASKSSRLDQSSSIYQSSIFAPERSIRTELSNPNIGKRIFSSQRRKREG